MPLLVLMSLMMAFPDAPAAPECSPTIPTGDGSAVTAEANDSVHVDMADRVELHVKDLPIPDVLRMLSRETKRNILASKEVAGTVTANLYGVTLEQALNAILRMNNLGFLKKDDIYYVHTQPELEAIQQSEQKTLTKVLRLKYITAADARTILTPLLGKYGKLSITPAGSEGIGRQAGGSGMGGSSGGSTSANSSSGNSTGGAIGDSGHSNAEMLVITETEDNLKNIERVLSDLDVRPQQVLIEATILRASLNESNAMGIDFTTMGGVDFAAVGSTSPADQSITTGNLPTPRLEDTTFTTRTAFNNAVPSGGLTFGIIKNNVGVFLRALEQITDSNVIANPKVLSLNKQQGQVIVGRRDGYVTTTLTETTAVQTIEFLETGTQLFFRPYILDDQYIRMEIHPEDSTGGLTAANLPFKQTTEVTTNVLVRDGHTILIGGLFREVTTTNRGQIPVLGNIPLGGILFRNSNDDTVREEVIILLTVHIVKGEPEEKEADRLADDVERFRLGARRGLLFTGRERLAQAHYRWALEHLAKGHVCRAIWDARLALENSPKMLPAIELIETLEQRRIFPAQWDPKLGIHVT